MSRFRIGAYNCQGLQDYKKRADVFTANERQPWTDSHDYYFEYLIIHFDYLIIQFDYLIIG